MTTETHLPEQIGPYRVTGHLGTGGMGEVVRGYDERLHRSVALKRVLVEAQDSAKALERFRREARAVAQLSHPAIVQVFDWVESEGQNWLVMELIEGETLDDLIAEGPLPPERAAAIAREVASGLAVAHAAGFVHRDLKAANVIVTTTINADDGSRIDGVKILDFGLAKSVAGTGVPVATITEEGHLLGTVTAMSPEQALGVQVDHRSDLFSLGSLLFEMLSGISPFAGKSAVDTLTRICTAKEKPLRFLVPEVPEGLARLVERLLEKDPARRPGNARQVVAELDRLMASATGEEESEEGSGSDDEGLESSRELTLFEGRVSQGTSEGRIGIEDEIRATASDELLSLQGGSSIRAHQRRWILATVALVVCVGLWASRGWFLPQPAPAPEVELQPAGDEVAADDVSSYEYFQRGMDLLLRYDLNGNIDKAIADFQRALAREPSSAPALAGLANAYRLDYSRGSQDPQRLEQALAAAERAVKLDEHLAVALVSLGLVHAELGHSKEAVREFNEALKIEPSNGHALYGLGRVSEANADFSQAEEYYLRAIEVDPDTWFFRSRLGSLLFQAGRYREAEAIFLRILEMTPDSAVGFRNLGGAYYMEGRLTEAATTYQQALQVQPDPRTYSSLGTIFFVQGLYLEAASAFKKAVESGGANDYVLWGNLADAYRWIPDSGPRARDAYNQAIDLLNARLAANPLDSTMRTRLVLYRAKLGDCKKSLAEIGKLNELTKGDSNAWFRIAVANEVCDQREEALAALEVALQAGFSSEEVKQDPELLELRRDVGYHQLTMRYR